MTIVCRNLRQAFEVTEEDIAAVLRSNALKVANSQGLAFSAMAGSIHQQWDEELDRVAQAALASELAGDGSDLDLQTRAAHGEIRTILVEQGILIH